MVLQHFCFDPKGSERNHQATEYCKSQWFCNTFALIQWPLTDTPGQQNTVDHNGFAIFCFDPMASDRHHLATEYCKSPWFCNTFALIQRLLTDTPMQQNIVYKSQRFCNILVLIQWPLTDTPGQQKYCKSQWFCNILL